MPAWTSQLGLKSGFIGTIYPYIDTNKIGKGGSLLDAIPAPSRSAIDVNKIKNAGLPPKTPPNDDKPDGNFITWVVIAVMGILTLSILFKD